MHQERSKPSPEALEELENLSSLSDAGWVVGGRADSDKPQAIEVWRHAYRLAPTNKSIINRLDVTDDEGRPRQGYSLWADNEGVIRIGYDGSDSAILGSFTEELIEFGKELDIADCMKQAYELRGLEAKFLVDPPGTIYEPHSHAAVRIFTISGAARARLGEGEWQQAIPGTELRIGDGQVHEADSGSQPWVYVFAASAEEMKRQGL